MAKPDLLVKTVFPGEGGCSERMWVIVTKIDRGNIVGKLDNVPACPRKKQLTAGQTVKFRVGKVVDTMISDGASETASVEPTARDRNPWILAAVGVAGIALGAFAARRR